jgi:hypothetical protein
MMTDGAEIRGLLRVDEMSLRCMCLADLNTILTCFLTLYRYVHVQQLPRAACRAPVLRPHEEQVRLK